MLPARFLTFSCYKRLPLLRHDRIKELFMANLAAARASHRFLLGGWVVMPEHVHLLIVPEARDIAQVLQGVKQPVARIAVARWRELGPPILDKLTDGRGYVRFWLPGGGYDRTLSRWYEFEEKLKYMHLNPVQRGLVTDPLEYRWSSARAWKGDDPDGLLDRLGR